MLSTRNKTQSLILKKKHALVHFRNLSLGFKNRYLKPAFARRNIVNQSHRNNKFLRRTYLPKLITLFKSRNLKLPKGLKDPRRPKRGFIRKKKKKMLRRLRAVKKTEWLRRTVRRALKKTSKLRYQKRKEGKLRAIKKRPRRRYLRKRILLSKRNIWYKSYINSIVPDSWKQCFVFRRSKPRSTFYALVKLTSDSLYLDCPTISPVSWFKLATKAVLLMLNTYIFYTKHYSLNSLYYFLENNVSTVIKRNPLTCTPLWASKINLISIPQTNNQRSETRIVLGFQNLKKKLDARSTNQRRAVRRALRRKKKPKLLRKTFLYLKKVCYIANRVKRVKRFPRIFRKQILDSIKSSYKLRPRRWYAPKRPKRFVTSFLKQRYGHSVQKQKKYILRKPNSKFFYAQNKQASVRSFLPFYKLSKLWKQPKYATYASTLLNFLQIRILHIARNQISLSPKHSKFSLNFTKLATYSNLKGLLINSKNFENSVSSFVSSEKQLPEPNNKFINWASARVKSLSANAILSKSLRFMRSSDPKHGLRKKVYRYKARYFSKSRRQKSYIEGLQVSQLLPPKPFALKLKSAPKLKPSTYRDWNTFTPSLHLLYFTTFNQLSLKWWLLKNLNNSHKFKSPTKLVTSLSNQWDSSYYNERYGFLKNSNLTPSVASHFFIKKRLYKVTTFNKFSLPVVMWYYQTLIKFMEATGGLRVRLQFNPFITHSLSFTDLARARLWAIRTGGFQRLLGHRIFINESLQILQLSVRTKDPTFLANWIKGMLGRMGFWKYRIFFRFLKYVFRYLFWPVFPEFNFKGLKLRLKGKVSVAGNARTRAIAYRIGETSNATYDNKVLHDYSIINTFTGVLGFQIWMYF